MENLKQKIERLQADKKTSHRPELLNDQQYCEWLENIKKDRPNTLIKKILRRG